MSERLFVFLQAELPFRLAFPDGRYVVRGRAGGQPEHVLVLKTLQAGPGRTRRRLMGRFGAGARERAWRGHAVEPAPQPARAACVRVTVIDPVSLSAERQAQAWLEALGPEQEIRAAFAVINRALFAQRIAGADPTVHAISPGQALTIRAGWGAGEQVADGQWAHARELHWADPRVRGRVAVLRPQERFTGLLGARVQPLVSEELALRAREDLEQGRTRHAALELDRAYAAALLELRPQAPLTVGRHGGPPLARWIGELEELRGGVADAADAALAAAAEADTEAPDGGLDADALAHALSRLEAALRARPAGRF
jgi:hypothetical protein